MPDQIIDGVMPRSVHADAARAPAGRMGHCAGLDRLPRPIGGPPGDRRPGLLRPAVRYLEVAHAHFQGR
jgi:hypothetical protein